MRGVGCVWRWGRVLSLSVMSRALLVTFVTCLFVPFSFILSYSTLAQPCATGGHAVFPWFSFFFWFWLGILPLLGRQLTVFPGFPFLHDPTFPIGWSERPVGGPVTAGQTADGYPPIPISARPHREVVRAPLHESLTIPWFNHLSGRAESKSSQSRERV